MFGSVLAQSQRRFSILAGGSFNYSSISGRAAAGPDRRLTSEQNQPLPHPDGHGFGPAGGAQLGEDRSDMKLHCMLGNAQAKSDVLVGEPLGKHSEHLDFTGRERAIQFSG